MAVYTEIVLNALAPRTGIISSSPLNQATQTTLRGFGIRAEDDDLGADWRLAGYLKLEAQFNPFANWGVVAEGDVLWGRTRVLLIPSELTGSVFRATFLPVLWTREPYQAAFYRYNT